MTETRTCPACDAENHLQNLYCEGCGSALPELGDEPPMAEATGFTLEPVQEEPLFLSADQQFSAEQEEEDLQDLEFEEVPPLEPVEEPAHLDQDPLFESPDEEFDGYILEPAPGDEFSTLEQAETTQPEPLHEWTEPAEVDAESVEDFLQAQLDDEPQEPQLLEETAPQEPFLQPQRTTLRPQIQVEPLPTPGGFEITPTLTLFLDKQAKEIFYLEEAAQIFGGSPADEETLQEQPQDEEEPLELEQPRGPQQIDLSPFASKALPQNFIAIYKQNKNLTLYALSDEPTQLNDELLALGEMRTLKDGDLIILNEDLAMRLEAAPS